MDQELVISAQTARLLGLSIAAPRGTAAMHATATAVLQGKTDTKPQPTSAEGGCGDGLVRRSRVLDGSTQPPLDFGHKRRFGLSHPTVVAMASGAHEGGGGDPGWSEARARVRHAAGEALGDMQKLLLTCSAEQLFSSTEWRRL